MRQKANQEPLPGMEAHDVPEIEQAAENYRTIRDERCELSKREADAKAALIKVMKNLGRSFYQYNGLKVQLEITDNVKVKSSEDGSEEPTGKFTQPRRKREAKEIASEWIKQAEELIEQQQQADSLEAGEQFFEEKCACGHNRRKHVNEDKPCNCQAIMCDCKDFRPAKEDARAEERDQTERWRQSSEQEREQLHREAARTWRRDGEAMASVEDEAVRDAKKFSEIRAEDYQAAGLAGLTSKEREKYAAAPCCCGHGRDWHGEEGRDSSDRPCSLCSKCEGYHCPDCETNRGHQATCKHYILGEGTPLQDDFTAPRCSECGRIDGAHTKECPKSNALRFEDYEAYARAHYKRNWSSHARKIELSKLKDEQVRAWKQQQAGPGAVKEGALLRPDPRILCWCKHKYADHREGTFCKKKGCGCNTFSRGAEGVAAELTLLCRSGD